MKTVDTIARYLTGTKRLDGPFTVAFLAAGEYNANYLVELAGGGRFVFRMNHGSQLGLADQIGYEFSVLMAVAPSGVTPRPLFCDPAPKSLPGGVLLMEFLPGRPLNYRTDLARAARIFARVHALPPTAGLIAQPDPVTAIADESYSLLTRFPDHPLPELRDRLLAYRETVLDLGRRHAADFAAEAPVMVNTEVNSGNFLMDDAAGDHLVDWEKAVISARYQDLGHFLVPTTTLWKTDVVLSPEQKRAFLAAYRAELEALGAPAPDLERMLALTRVLERTILLRALAWCHMAFYEYTMTERAIANPATLATIRRYLEDAPCFVG